MVADIERKMIYEHKSPRITAGQLAFGSGPYPPDFKDEVYCEEETVQVWFDDHGSGYILVIDHKGEVKSDVNLRREMIAAIKTADPFPVVDDDDFVAEGVTATQELWLNRKRFLWIAGVLLVAIAVARMLSP